ncbi:MAG TPA: glycerol-3-phosphate 1-O-acyltransferase PlsY [Urbifossiella sp.]
MLAAILLLTAAYLIGAIPFGYLIGRIRGIDLFQAGSGNIGATNAGRVLGRKFGILVFILDFLKGAAPTSGIVPLARMLDPDASTALGSPEALRAGAAALAFLGHLFPIYLGFRGGKGVATGAGTIFVLAPGPAALAILGWIVVLFASRIVSLASLAAISILVTAWLLLTPSPLAPDALPITVFLLAGAVTIAVKHRTNITRLIAGTENRIGDFPMRDPLVRSLHLLALGLWFGGAAFFNFVAAVPIFESFKQVVQESPSDRTAFVDITNDIPKDNSEKAVEQRKALASALAGAAVGPIFPRYFALQAVCGAIALATAGSWLKGGRRIDRGRFYLIAVALLLVAVAWPISNMVSELRPQRFDPARAAAASAAFSTWHLVSLILSAITTCLAGVALALAANLPDRR